MSRPTKATVDYFPHYVAHGKTMFIFEGKYGNDGYAFWFKTLEILGSTEQHFIDCNDECAIEFLLARTHLERVIVIEMLNLLAKTGAIDSDLWENKIIWSENFISNLVSVYSRRIINVYGKPELMDYCTHKHYIKEINDESIGVVVGINPQSIVNHTIVNHSIKEKSKKEVLKFDDDSIEMRLSKYLYEKIKERYPSLKEPKLNSWASVMDAILRLDHKSEGDIVDLIDWSQNSDFWWKVIQSPSNLRENWDKLMVQSISKPKKKTFDPEYTIG